MRPSSEALAFIRLPARESNLAECLAAAVACVALSPALVGLAAAVALVSRRTPLVAHRRIGYGGEPFWMLKFRSMWECEAPATGHWQLVEQLPTATVVPADKTQPDARVRHPLARWIRRYSLDELPQLVHVARGQMAFVGPRPLTAAEINEHYDDVAAELTSELPGLTGLWQVMGRSKLTRRQRRRLDLFWVRRRNGALLCHVLLRTVPLVLTGKNAA